MDVAELASKTSLDSASLESSSFVGGDTRWTRMVTSGSEAAAGVGVAVGDGKGDGTPAGLDGGDGRVLGALRVPGCGWWGSTSPGS